MKKKIKDMMPGDVFYSKDGKSILLVIRRIETILHSDFKGLYCVRTPEPDGDEPYTKKWYYNEVERETYRTIIQPKTK